MSQCVTAVDGVVIPVICKADCCSFCWQLGIWAALLNISQIIAPGPIVARLLETGHTVHGTCRAPEKQDTVAHLLALPGAAERLKLFKADLLLPDG